MSLFLTYREVHPMSRMAEAEISAFKGIPCFTISKKEEKRNGIPMLGALIVSDVSIEPTEKVWSFIFPGTITIPMHANTCLLYGRAPAGAETIPAKPLKKGKMYSVFLNARPDDPSDSTYGYKGKFCIAATANNSQQVIPIKKGTQAWIDNICPVPR